MKKLLLLDNRFTADTSDMWRTAIKLGWKTERTNMYKVKEHMEGYDFIRYYGNTLHAAQIKDQLPFKFIELPQILNKKELKPYTKRNISKLKFTELIRPIEEDYFIKPAREKWFEARVYKKGENISYDYKPNDEIYVQDIVKFIDEIRCFVLNGEILTSSYYRINSIVWDATNESPENINFDKKIKNSPLPQMAKEIFNLNPELPKGIVMDFGLLPNGEYCLIEFNEAYASGLYYCDYEKCLDVIVASEE